MLRAPSPTYGPKGGVGGGGFYGILPEVVSGGGIYMKFIRHDHKQRGPLEREGGGQQYNTRRKGQWVRVILFKRSHKTHLFPTPLYLLSFFVVNSKRLTVRRIRNFHTIDQTALRDTPSAPILTKRPNEGVSEPTHDRVVPMNAPCMSAICAVRFGRGKGGVIIPMNTSD